MTESIQSALTHFYCRQVLLRLVPLGQVQNVRITLCNFHTWQIFTLERPEILFHQRNPKSRSTKVTVGRKAKSGGSDPAFLRQAAQKVSGVAPALDAIAVGLFPTVMSGVKQSFMHALLKSACRKGEPYGNSEVTT
jgi:hypothetical protein